MVITAKELGGGGVHDSEGRGDGVCFYCLCVASRQFHRCLGTTHCLLVDWRRLCLPRYRLIVCKIPDVSRSNPVRGNVWEKEPCYSVCPVKAERKQTNSANIIWRYLDDNFCHSRPHLVNIPAPTQLQYHALPCQIETRTVGVSIYDSNIYNKHFFGGHRLQARRNHDIIIDVSHSFTLHTCMSPCIRPISFITLHLFTNGIFTVWLILM